MKDKLIYFKSKQILIPAVSIVSLALFVFIAASIISGFSVKKENNKSVLPEQTTQNNISEPVESSTSYMYIPYVESEDIDDPSDYIFEFENYIAENETHPEEYNEEQIIEMIEDTDKPIDIISNEKLEIVEETKVEIPEPDKIEVEVIEPTQEEVVASTQFENSSLAYGIDVSKWQGDIDWTKVANSGIDYAIIKCGGRSTGSDGELYEDSKFQKNIQGALANGIQVGIYFFSQAVTIEEVYEEASFCINLIDKYQITYPVAFDWESADGFRVANANISVEQLTKFTEVFCEVIKSHNYQPMVYYCRNDWYNRVNASQLIGKYKAWLAVYFGEHYYTSKRWEYGYDLPSFKYNYDMWQYGVTNTVDGINGYVDMNISFFSYSNYKVDNLSTPKLTVTDKKISGYSEEAIDLTKNITAKNCLGYDVQLLCDIYDKDNKLIAEDVVYNPDEEISEWWYVPGIYTVEYHFQDPKYGRITDKAELTLIKRPYIVIPNTEINYYEDYTPDLFEDVKGYDSNDKPLEIKYSLTDSNNKEVILEDILKQPGTYTVVYGFKDKSLEKFTYTCTLIINEGTRPIVDETVKPTEQVEQTTTAKEPSSTKEPSTTATNATAEHTSSAREKVTPESNISKSAKQTS